MKRQASAKPIARNRGEFAKLEGLAPTRADLAGKSEPGLATIHTFTPGV